MQLRMLKLSVEKGHQVRKQPSFAQVAILQSIAERAGYVLYRALVLKCLLTSVHLVYHYAHKMLLFCSIMLKLEKRAIMLKIMPA